MRVSAGVREDKDPTDSLPACATCISSCRSCCAQIRPASIAVYRCTSWKRTCGERTWKKRGIREKEEEDKEKKETKPVVEATKEEDDEIRRRKGEGRRNGRRERGDCAGRRRKKEKRGTEAKPRWTTAINATPPRENCLEYTRNILSTRVFLQAASSFGSRGHELRNGHGLKEEKRAREQPHDRLCRDGSRRRAAVLRLRSPRKTKTTPSYSFARRAV